MHNLVQRILRGIIFCVVTVVITACAGVTEISESGNSSDTAAAKSDGSLPRIDAIRLRVAQNAMENRDYNTAIRFFESVRKSSPAHPAPLIGIAQAHMAAGNHGEAILAYRDVLEMHSDNDEALDGIARALVLTGDYRGAIEYFNRSLANAPSAPLHNRLGVAHDLAGDGEGAQKHYRAALALDPEAISPRNNLALSLAISEDYDEAIKQIERVAAHPQATGKHRQNLSFIYGMAGENDEALAGLSEAGLTPSEVAENRALYKRIRAHARAGNRAAILEYLRNGREMGDPMVADSMAEPAYPAGEMAALNADHDSNPPTEAAERGPVSVTKPKTTPTKLGPKRSRMAVISDPVRDGVGLAGMVYRVQLAAYRTSKATARGVRVLKSILRDAAPVFKTLVRDPRRKDKRAIDFRIRTPKLANREVAMDLCSKVKNGGHPDCLVILHNPRIWANVDVPDAPKTARSTRPSRLAANRMTGPFHLQLASYRTHRAATKGRAILKKLLGGKDVALDILVRRAVSNDPAIFRYQVRSGPIATRSEGVALCEALKKQGHQGCLMIQHNARVWKNLTGDPASEKAAIMAPDMPSMPSKTAEKSTGDMGSGDMKANPTQKSGMDKKPAETSKKVENKHKSAPVVLSKKAPMTEPTKLQKRSSLQSPENKRQVALENIGPAYRVQFASFRTEGAAAKGQNVLKKILSDRDVSLDILVKRVRSSGTRAFDYQIRSGPIQSRSEGMALCAKLKKAGHTGCLVVQHNDQLWKTLAKGPKSKKSNLKSSRNQSDPEGTQRPQKADPVSLVIELPRRSVMETVDSMGLGSSDLVPLSAPLDTRSMLAI